MGQLPMSVSCASARTGGLARLLPCAAVLLALAALYVPVFWQLQQGLWQVDQHAHGPLVLAVWLWLAYRALKQALRDGLAQQPAPLRGVAALALGMLSYVAGRAQGLPLLQVASLPMIVLGTVLVLLGPAVARRFGFTLFFTVFLLPLPASFIDALTQPLKLGVSAVVENLLHWAGYPVARSGVTLLVGSYRLLVADACSGLHSLFMLEAFALCYMNLVRYQSPLRNAGLALLIVPISFMSNVLRVVILALITVHWGDEAGQGFVHTLSGSLLFASALVLVISADTALRAAFPAHVMRAGAKRRLAPDTTASYARPPLRRGHAFMVSLTLLAGLGVAPLLEPQWRTVAELPELDAAVPVAFGDWQWIQGAAEAVRLSTDERGTVRQPYDETVIRFYRNGAGRVVTLALAYGREQRQEIKVHRPEICYTAAGFHVAVRREAVFEGLETVHGPVQGQHLFAQGQEGDQAVSYWIRIGEVYAEGGWAVRRHLLALGMQGQVPDGILVRASVPVQGRQEAEAAWPELAAFLVQLAQAMPPEARRVLAR